MNANLCSQPTESRREAKFSRHVLNRSKIELKISERQEESYLTLL